ncbi:MAG TPA: stalk domain-containing protein, partial [Syntrophomonas sp.]|nr:stalk domain-containing protein [Syntrophomonas sp.]
MLPGKMSKKIIVLGLFLCFAIITVNPVQAAQSSGSGDFNININSEKLIIPAEDQQPMIIDGRTYVPLRVISENMGAKVEWIDDSRQVIILWKNQSIDIWPDSQGEDVQIIIDGKTLEIPSALGKAYLSELGRTMIPLRAVGEAMSCEVNWINESRTVEINFTPPAVNNEEETPGNDNQVENPGSNEEQANLQLLKD